MAKYKTYTFNFLIKRVLEFVPDDYLKYIGQIAKWAIQSSENFLLSLLLNRQDEVATQYCKIYMKDAKIDLMIFALRN